MSIFDALDHKCTVTNIHFVSNEMIMEIRLMLLQHKVKPFVKTTFGDISEINMRKMDETI